MRCEWWAVGNERGVQCVKCHVAGGGRAGGKWWAAPNVRDVRWVHEVFEEEVKRVWELADVDGPGVVHEPRSDKLWEALEGKLLHAEVKGARGGGIAARSVVPVRFGTWVTAPMGGAELAAARSSGGQRRFR